jgi:nondiscriminating aspartyl-tRNA synthetase
MENINKRTFAAELNSSMVGKQVTIAGWLEDLRDIGKIGFASIRDMTGTLQALVSDETLSIAKEIPRQSTLIIQGKVQNSRAKNVKVEIKVTKLLLVGKALHPLPIDPTGRVESSLDKRLDSRALDLRNPCVSSIFKTKSKVLQTIRNVLVSKKFIEVHTPKIIGSATEGGANLFSFDYFKRTGYLAQSPQLFKEQLVLGLERIFEIGPYFRAEPSHTGRHLSEFVSVDFEAAYLEYYDIMDIVEELISKVIKNVSEATHYQSFANGYNRIDGKIPRISYQQCLGELSSVGDKLEFGDDLSDASLKKLGEIYPGFYFILDWPTKLKPFYILEQEQNPEISKSFDLQYGYLELVSGGRREHNFDILRSKLVTQGLNPDLFSDHLKTFEWGMPIHSGCGLGLDRLMMVLTGTNNIRETVLYPRDTERLNP